MTSFFFSLPLPILPTVNQSVIDFHESSLGGSIVLVIFRGRNWMGEIDKKRPTGWLTHMPRDWTGQKKTWSHHLYCLAQCVLSCDLFTFSTTGVVVLVVVEDKVLWVACVGQKPRRDIRDERRRRLASSQPTPLIRSTPDLSFIHSLLTDSDLTVQTATKEATRPRKI